MKSFALGLTLVLVSTCYAQTKLPASTSKDALAKLIKGAREIFYPGLPHGLTATNADQVNADLLEFLRSVQKARKAASA